MTDYSDPYLPDMDADAQARMGRAMMNSDHEGEFISPYHHFEFSVVEDWHTDGDVEVNIWYFDTRKNHPGGPSDSQSIYFKGNGIPRWAGGDL